MFSRPTVESMAEEADKAINTILLHGTPSMVVRPKKEIAYVAAVTLGGIHGIADAWGRIPSRRGLAMRLAGVYCHAAPIVRFVANGETRDCELADLLVVTDVRKSGVLTRRAALIQAKMARAKDRVSLTGPSTKRQLHLYQNWPRFDFIDPAYDMTRVNFRVGADPFLSGTFGVIDPRFNGQPRWTQHKARPTPAIIQRNDHRLGRFIAEMVDGKRLIDVAPATVVRELNTLSHAIETALRDWGLWLPRNPVKMVRRPTCPTGVGAVSKRAKKSVSWRLATREERRC